MVMKKLKSEIKLVNRHIGVLKILEQRGPLGIIKLSQITKRSPSQVRYSLRVLQQYGFLQPTTKGAKFNKKAVNFIKNLDSEKKKLLTEISKI